MHEIIIEGQEDVKGVVDPTIDAVEMFCHMLSCAAGEYTEPASIKKTHAVVHVCPQNISSLSQRCQKRVTPSRSTLSNL